MLRRSSQCCVATPGQHTPKGLAEAKRGPGPVYSQRQLLRKGPLWAGQVPRFSDAYIVHVPSSD